MQIGRGKSARNIDGVDGYAAAQYANSARGIPGGAQNNAEFGFTGTFVAKKTITSGTEILIRYDGSKEGGGYWDVWDDHSLTMVMRGMKFCMTHETLMTSV